MKLRRVRQGRRLVSRTSGRRMAGSPSRKCLAALALSRAEEAGGWAVDMVALLGAPAEVRARIAEAALSIEPEPTPDSDVVMPFAPRSFRDFMLYEAHAIAAARGFVREFMPGAARDRAHLRGADGADLSQAQAARAVVPPAHLLHGQSSDGRDRRRRGSRSPPTRARSTTSWSWASCWRSRCAMRHPKPPRRRSAGSWCSTTSPRATCKPTRWPPASARRRPSTSPPPSPRSW